MIKNLKNQNVIRKCANEIIDCFENYNEYNQLTEHIQTPLSKLLNISNLCDLGVPRQGNNVSNSKYLYFDCEFSILLFEVEKGKIIPPHDHGVTEILCVYKGKLQHKLYSRIDDKKTNGYAKLETIHDKEISSGDVVIVSPPNDIHGFKSLSDDTFGITIVNGNYKVDRHYYNTEENSYVIKSTPNSR